MVTIQFYNQARSILLKEDMDAIPLKFMLLNNTPVFNAAHTDLATVAGANEVSGNGWAVGGEALTGVAVTIINTNEAKLDAADIVKTATGGSIGPAFKGVLYHDDAGVNPVIAFVDFQASEEAVDGRDFVVRWNAAGIVSGTAP